MYLYSFPSDYSPAFADNLFVFREVDSTALFDVEFHLADEDDTLLGVKRFSGSTVVEANISNYLRRSLNPQPYRNNSASVVCAVGRCVEAYASYGVDNSSDTVLFTSAMTALQAHRIVRTDNRTRTIGLGECDEVAFTATEGDTLTVSFTDSATGEILKTLNTTASCSGIWIVNVAADDVIAAADAPASVSGFNVTIAAGGQEIGTVEYEVVDNPAASVRLCWLNRLGCIDYHTFTLPAEERFTAERRNIDLPTGRRVADACMRRETDLVSGYLSIGAMERLSQILFAPFVWCVGDGGFQLQTVLKASAVCSNPQTPGYLKLTIAPALDSFSQRF